MNLTLALVTCLLWTGPGSRAAGSVAWGAEGGGGPHSGGTLDAVWEIVEAATEAPTDERAKQLLREAEELARSSLAGHEDDVEHRYALAAVLGLRANIEGGRAAVQAASELLPELEAILAVDPEHAGARHILGRLHAGVRRMNRVTRWIATRLMGGDLLGGASWEEAEEHLAFAERLAPEVLDHHLQLALLYRDTGRPDMAAEEITHVMSLQARSALEIAVQAEAVEVWSDLESQ